MDNIKKIKWALSHDNPNYESNKKSFQKEYDYLMATDWNYAIKEHIKTGLESPTPYKVVPYKNGIGIKKTVFLKPIKPIKVVNNV